MRRFNVFDLAIVAAALTFLVIAAGCSVKVDKSVAVNIPERDTPMAAATQPAVAHASQKGGKDAKAEGGARTDANSQKGYVNVHYRAESKTDAETEITQAMRAALEAALTGQGSAEQTGGDDSGGQLGDDGSEQTGGNE